MTPQQKDILRRTWNQVAPIADQAAALFYETLFRLDPELRRYFADTDLADQRRKLVHALSVVVAGLDRPETLQPVLAALGRRHAGYGVEDRHYETVGAALIATLKEGIGGDWNDDAEAAWTSAYAFVSSTMRAAAADTGAEAAA